MKLQFGVWFIMKMLHFKKTAIPETTLISFLNLDVIHLIYILDNILNLYYNNTIKREGKPSKPKGLAPP